MCNNDSRDIGTTLEDISASYLEYSIACFERNLDRQLSEEAFYKRKNLIVKTDES